MLAILRQDARHFFFGTHEAKTKDPTRPQATKVEPVPEPEGEMGEILRAITEPMSADAISERVGMDPGLLRSQLTMLEIQGLVRREGSRFIRVR